MQKVLTSETKVMCHEYVNYFKQKEPSRPLRSQAFISPSCPPYHLTVEQNMTKQTCTKGTTSYLQILV
jgi:hypothetical protein